MSIWYEHRLIQNNNMQTLNKPCTLLLTNSPMTLRQQNLYAISGHEKEKSNRKMNKMMTKTRKAIGHDNINPYVRKTPGSSV